MRACQNAGGGEIYLPAGIYLINKRIVDSLSSSGTFINTLFTMRGDGPSATSIKLAAQLSGTPTIFNISGKTTGDGSTDRATWFTLKDITLDGNYQAATWLDFYRASSVRLDHVQIVNTLGRAINGKSFWDSVFHDVLFDNVGNSTGSVPSFELASSTTSGEAQPSSNNIKLEAVQFANYPASAVIMNQGTHAIFFLGSSFTGGTSPVSLTAVKFNGTSDQTDYTLIGACSFTGCRFLRSDVYFIYAAYATGMTISGCTFEQSKQSAIYLANCKYCIITGNNFATSAGACANGTSMPGTDMTRNLAEYFAPPATSTNHVYRNLGGAGV
jgi:parallel beta-helix repeat protein